jgi:DNA replication protein
LRLFVRKTMSDKVFSGFPSGSAVTPIPNLFFTEVMPMVEGVVELKAVLHIFWLLSRRRGYPQMVTGAELLADQILMSGIEAIGTTKEEMLHQALQQAVQHGIMLRVRIDREGRTDDAYLINNEAGRAAVGKIERGELPQLSRIPAQGDIKGTLPRDIFSLYERNIGILTPLIAEQLQEAERLYPADWIEGAFKEAAALNKRSWKYILRILERWAIEGRDDGKSGRDTEKESDREKYIRGKYGHMVKG